MSSKQKTLLLLDSHAIIHRAYHAVPDFRNSQGVPTGALFGIINMLFGILERYKPDAVIACYDLPHPTYRHEIYEAYKGNRKKSDDDLITQIKSSREIFEDLCIPMYDKPGFEADDILGTIVHKVTADGHNQDEEYKVIIASGDMDTMQLIKGDQVLVYTLKKGLNDTIIYNEEAVIKKYGMKPMQLIDYKGLRGDTSDNIIGVPGVGEKTATTIIQEFESIENMYEYIEVSPFSKTDARYKKAGISERFYNLLVQHKDDAIFSKALATIRLDAPIDFDLVQKEPWYECADIEAFNKLIERYELKSIRGKLERVIEIQKGNKPVKIVDDTWGVENKTPLTEEEKIKVSLLRSHLLNPTRIDVENNFDKHKSLDQYLKEEGVLELYEKVEKPLIPILKKMKETGIKVDVKYLENLSHEYQKYLDNLKKEIYELAGEEFNISSPKQLGEILYDKLDITKGSKVRIKKTGAGARSTKESELDKMIDLHPIISKILEHREYSKLLTTYIDVILQIAKDEKDNRIHPDFIQIGAVTGRMASANPSMQNIPIKTDLGRAIRSAFIAEKDYDFVSIDYSQIELRIATILSGDKTMGDIFKNKEDIHTGVAKQVYKLDSLDQVTPDMRRHAKAINFGILYGMGVQALGRSISVSQSEAQEFYMSYYSTFKELANYLQQCKIDAERIGYTKTLFGRRRYFPELKSNIPFIKSSGERMALNAPIQGTNADMIKLAMVEIEKYIENNKLNNDIRMLAPIHDELLFEIKKGKENYVKEIQSITENVLKSWNIETEVPILTNVKIADRW
jgi:DNA polymerase I